MFDTIKPNLDLSSPQPYPDVEKFEIKSSNISEDKSFSKLVKEESEDDRKYAVSKHKALIKASQ